jgi:hypothetical protein
LAGAHGRFQILLLKYILTFDLRIFLWIEYAKEGGIEDKDGLKGSVS